MATKEISLTLTSGKQVTLKSLNAWERILLDDISSTDTQGIPPPIRMLSIRTIGSIKSIDGQAVGPFRTPIDIQRVAENLEAQELDEILEAYAENFNPTKNASPTEVADNLKNESTPDSL